MTRLERLNAKLVRLMSKKENLAQRAMASTDANEVRSLNDELTEVNADIADVQADIADAKAEEEMRSAKPVNATPVNTAVVGAFGQTNGQSEKRSGNPYESMEYRHAFMNYVQRGEKLPQNVLADLAEYHKGLTAEQRAGMAITTADTAPAIPLTIMREVINTIRNRYGNLYAKVTKMSIAGGVEFPIGALQASFKWINESTVSPRQKLAPLGKVQFSYHTAEIRLAQSFLSALLTIDAFENKLTQIIAEAYVKAMDIAIVSGTGDGQPTGILNDARVAATGNVITMTAAQMSSWVEWRKRFFAKLPLGYRAGEFIFPLSTVETYLETMADANNNPIFRQATGLVVNDGDAVNPNGTFFGRNISLVEPDILGDFDTASADDVIGIYWQPTEYAINENFGFTMRRYYDEETNEWVDKAIAVVDGKVLNPNGIWLIKKA